MYIYRLGHIKELAVAEFHILTGTNSSQSKVHNGYLFSDTLVDVNDTGSLVWCGRIIEENIDANNIEQALQNYFNNNPIKKLGVATEVLDKSIHKTLIPILKNCGVKKINLLNKTEPSFGDYKYVKEWILFSKINETVSLIKLESFSNQEFWASLDTNLPENDMERGMINLKLARSMINIAASNNIWDPFAGYGRLIIAGMDRCTAFTASDIDESTIVPLTNNYNYAETFFNKYQSRISKKEITLAKLNNTFAQDITATLNIIVPSTIVTEGYLGPTKNSPRNEEEAIQSFSDILGLWSKAIANLQSSGVTKIIATLPFYTELSKPSKQDYLSMIDKMLSQTKTSFVRSNIDQYEGIWYARKHTRVGHLIVCFIKK
jgi:hypothetical protein